jgi:PncC family amidohydrolase
LSQNLPKDEKGIRMIVSENVTLADAVDLARRTGDLLRSRGWMLATAESCTGGLIGHIVTENAGCSDYFAGAAVTYSNAAKQALLAVRPETLAAHGAVSAATAAEMASGALRLYAADVAVSVTGIVGPGGGSPDKPTGTVYLHLAARDGTQRSEHFVWQSDRSGNKLLSAYVALQMVQDYVRPAA